VKNACLTVEVDILCGELFVPKAFSPNGDGENEVEYVMGNCINNLEFAIFDRWGEKVFETTDITIGWDGTYKGKKLDAAVFVYYLKATVKGVEVNMHGNITLVK
ncbi:MAG: gliding motility-associated C-terminal domain-containing protein, partial [Bacteroidia bacterium]|nr:gliding motility-associated C-terminal domain-containing protein [Bacteroidia bacterium]